MIQSAKTDRIKPCTLVHPRYKALFNSGLSWFRVQTWKTHFLPRNIYQFSDRSYNRGGCWWFRLDCCYGVKVSCSRCDTGSSWPPPEHCQGWGLSQTPGTGTWLNGKITPQTANCPPHPARRRKVARYLCDCDCDYRLIHDDIKQIEKCWCKIWCDRQLNIINLVISL